MMDITLEQETKMKKRVNSDSDMTLNAVREAVPYLGVHAETLGDLTSEIESFLADGEMPPKELLERQTQAASSVLNGLAVICSFIPSGE